jgi:nitroreductase
VGGIVFHRTKDLKRIQAFYQDRIGMTVWLDQSDCVILKHNNLLLGFCERDGCDAQGIVTIFYEQPSDVDVKFNELQDIATDSPKENETYRIYHFFAKDPEGRMLEFQAFLHPLSPHMAGDDLLLTRRSIRSYENRSIPDEVLWQLFELCRYSPTSRNCQSYYFVVVRDRAKLAFMAELRGGSSSPIARAPLAVAVCVDATKTKRVYEDGCIAAYHFLLAAKLQGLGTCWIAAMDRDDVKETLGIPKEDYIATVTPLGYPSERPKALTRRDAESMVRFVD